MLGRIRSDLGKMVSILELLTAFGRIAAAMSAQREAPGFTGASRLFPQAKRRPAKDSAVYIESIHSLGVKPVVTDWPTFGPLLRIRRNRPVFTFWNVSVLPVVNT